MKTILENELWVGNIKGTVVPEKYKSLKTLRVGSQAFDIYGKPLDKNLYRPLIINKSELMDYDKIYMDAIKVINRQ